VSDDLDAKRPVIVTMPAGIDAGNASAVGDALDAAFAQGAMGVVADCTLTTFCDSIGFNTLLLANQKAHAAKAELLFVITPSGPLRRVLELLEMQDELAVYPNIDAAVAASGRLPLTRTAAAILSRVAGCFAAAGPGWPGGVAGSDCTTTAKRAPSCSRPVAALAALTRNRSPRTEFLHVGEGFCHGAAVVGVVG
jgi:anti-anti-sigma factor